MSEGSLIPGSGGADCDEVVLTCCTAAVGVVRAGALFTEFTPLTIKDTWCGA